VRLNLSIAILLGLMLSTAHAQTSSMDEAKAAFAAGKAAFERGDYETALAQYQRANLLVPAPSLSYNIGTTFEHLGRYRDAALAFERYLEQAGPPQSDDDQKFQDNLRARAAADRKRAEKTATPTAPASAPPATAPAVPPPQVPPAATATLPPVYAPPPGSPYYVGGVPPMSDRELRLSQARSRRARAIALVVVGGVLTIAGAGVLGDGLTNPHDRCGSAPSTTDCANLVEDWFGGTLIIVGITLWAPGTSSLVQSQRIINQLSKPEPVTPGPGAFSLRSPVFRF
jgi:hypothetical protein